MLSPLITRPACVRCALRQQIRHATLIRRPKRPYTFTQLVTLSDGSTFLHRTTSPQPVYRSAKDTKNTAMWNPSSQKLLNVEEDEAGRLRRFRKRFGRGFDSESTPQDDATSERAKNAEPHSRNDSLMDLLSNSYEQDSKGKGNMAGVTEDAKKNGKDKGGAK